MLLVVRITAGYWAFAGHFEDMLSFHAWKGWGLVNFSSLKFILSVRNWLDVVCLWCLEASNENSVWCWSLLLALTGIAFVDMLYVLVTSSTTCTRLVWSYLTITCSLLGWQSASPSNRIIVPCCVLHGPHFMGTNVVATPSFEHGGRDLNRSLFVCRSGFHLASKLIVSFFNFLTHLLYWKSSFFKKKNPTLAF